MKTMNLRLMETPLPDGGAGPAIADGDSTPPVDTGRGVFEEPNFADIAMRDDSLIHADPKPSGEGAAPKPAETPPAQSVVPPASPAALAPAAAAPAAPVALAAVPSPDPKPAVPPVAAGTETPPATPEAPKPQEPAMLTMEQHRAKAVPELSKLFEMTPEEVEAFKVEPEKTLPVLAARVAFESTMMAYQAVQAALPQLISGFMEHRTGVEQRNKQFFDAWPGLKETDETHVKTITNSIKAFKAANPQITDVAAIIKGAGALACVSLGIPLPGMPPQTPAAPPAPPRPAGAGAGGAPLPPISPIVEEDPVKALIAAQERGELY